MYKHLKGLRVLDLTRRLPGPLCTKILADLGADVIKVEQPRYGDSFRNVPPMAGNTGALFQVLNDNKRGLTLNLKKPAGRKLILQMASKIDIIVEDHLPGAMRDLSLDYDNLREINPRIIYCSLSGFGQNGPRSNIPSHDINILAISGILDLLRDQDKRPIVPAVQIAGIGGGSLSAVIGILSCVVKLEKTGEGDHIDVSMLDGLTPFLSIPMAQYAAEGTQAAPGTSLGDGGYACYNTYETKDGRYIVLGCIEDKFWNSFCESIERPDLIGKNLAPPEEQASLINILRCIIRKKTKKEWMKIFAPLNICVSPVNTLEEAVNDPQIVHRRSWNAARTPEPGKVLRERPALSFLEKYSGENSPAPDLGEHTNDILKEIGYNEKDIISFRENGVI